MKEYNSGFISSFKTGDNINYNLAILKKLYWYYNDEHDTEEKLYNRSFIIRFF